MIQYIVTFTNGTQCIIEARDGRHVWQLASRRAANSGRTVEDITL